MMKLIKSTNQVSDSLTDEQKSFILKHSRMSSSGLAQLSGLSNERIIKFRQENDPNPEQKEQNFLPLDPEQKEYVRKHTKYTVRYIANQLKISYKRVERYRVELQEAKNKAA